MSEQILKKIAVNHFSEFGYEGTKLSHIAQEAGIKKQSLYFYFKSKEDLLLQVNEMVLAEEIAFLQVFFQENIKLSLKELLYALLIEYKNRYFSNKNRSFMFLMAFIPPASLQSYFLQTSHVLISHLKTLLKPQFLAEKNLRIDPIDGPTSFIILLDGLFTQLIFETAKDFDNALRISWDIYWNGLSKKI